MINQRNGDKENCLDNKEGKVKKTNWLPWGLAAVMGVLLAYQYTGTSGTATSWIPLLAGLICPLMMLFMMFGLGHGHCNSNHSQEQNGVKQGGCCDGHQKKQTSGNKSV